MVVGLAAAVAGVTEPFNEGTIWARVRVCGCSSRILRGAASRASGCLDGCYAFAQPWKHGIAGLMRD